MGIPQVASVKPYRESIGPKGVLWAIFGNEDEFRALCAEAKAHGIRIMLDGVFSHTGA